MESLYLRLCLESACCGFEQDRIVDLERELENKKEELEDVDGFTFLLWSRRACRLQSRRSFEYVLSEPTFAGGARRAEGRECHREGEAEPWLRSWRLATASRTLGCCYYSFF